MQGSVSISDFIAYWFAMREVLTRKALLVMEIVMIENDNEYFYINNQS